MLPRIRWYSVGMAIVLAGTVACAVEEQTVSSLDYWPMQPGMAWLYQTAQGQQHVVRVVGQTTLDGQAVTVIERSSAGSTKTFRKYYAVQDGAILVVAVDAPPGQPGAGPRRVSPPMLLYPARLTQGRSWDYNPAQPGMVTMTVRGEETVTVPAGTYHAVVMVTTSTGSGTTTQWLAPQVGAVRTVVSPPDSGTAFALELVRFTVAGETAAPITQPRVIGQ